MVDTIVELDNNRKYVLLDDKKVENDTYYFGLRLDEHEEPTNNYLFLKEIKDGDDVYLEPVEDETMRGLLATMFTTNYIDKNYDNI